MSNPWTYVNVENVKYADKNVDTLVTRILNLMLLPSYVLTIYLPIEFNIYIQSKVRV